MRKVSIIAIAVVILVLVLGGIVLATIEIPASTTKVEKSIPDSKMPQ